VIASELVEAGRAVNRGLVTPDRTTLIASTHRDYTIGEKIALGDGRTDSSDLLDAARAASAKFIAFDMAAVAEKSGGRISAVIFGAIAGSGVLRWDPEDFREAIRESGIGVESSLAAFEAGRQCAAAGANPDRVGAPSVDAPGDRLQSLPPTIRHRVLAEFAPALHELLGRAAARLIDYQDEAYAAMFLDRVAAVAAIDSPAAAGSPLRLTQAVARSLVLWMSFEDVIRVAQAKTRAGRAEQIRGEVRAAPSELVRVKEYVKPRVEEICATLPAAWGRRLLSRAWATQILARFTAGRQISTSTISGFLLLRMIAGLRRFRRGMLRYATENQRIEGWLAQIKAVALRDYQLAVELAECQNLVKGYGDTHARGWRSFELISGVVPRLVGTGLAAERLRSLREAALADDSGAKLERLLAETVGVCAAPG
jgi:indolepyruvate ferredoxin oxidoreductase beta subunit